MRKNNSLWQTWPIFAPMAGLYLHVPFCRRACHYCDFHFSTQLDYTKQLCAAMAHELELRRRYLETEIIETVYLGGGTPSILPMEDFELIFGAIHKNFSVAPRAEITLEVNPDDVTGSSASAWKTLGINRISVGIQTLNDKVLQYLNRSHNSEQAHNAVKALRNVGFNNLNLDLIYAIPGRNLASLKRDVDQFLAYSPEHIAAYSLTIEPKTVFGHQHKRGTLVPVDEDCNAHEFEYIGEKLEGAGFQHYEISNYARPGFISQHNSSYWMQKKYLGIGPSAHSFNGHARSVNLANNAGYIKQVQNDVLPATDELLTREDKINEYIMTSIRTMWGCQNNYLMAALDFDLLNVNKAYLSQCQTQGLLVIDQQTILLTQKGKLLADKIAEDLFVVNSGD